MSNEAVTGLGTGETEHSFAGEMRQFRIRLGEIRRIEAKCGNVGIGEVLRRLGRANLILSDGRLTGTEALAAGLEFRADDVREVIYQGLTGHGMPTGVAFKLVSDEIDQRGVHGLVDNVGIALQVLMGSQRTPAAVDDPGEPRAGPTTTSTPPSPPTSSTSTASARPSATRRGKSTNSPPGS